MKQDSQATTVVELKNDNLDVSSLEESGFVTDAGNVESLEPKRTHISSRYVEEHQRLDIAQQYAQNGHHGEPIPPRLRRNLALKADLYLFSFMGWCYCLQFADKTVVNGCSVLGLRDKQIGLNMTGNLYSWVGSSFYFGYLVGIMPMVFLMQRFPVSKVTSICYILWAIVLTVSAASQSYAGFVTTRVILGVLESAVTPAFTVLTAQWFPRHSHFSRICLWFGFNGIGTILASSLAYGVYIHQDKVGGAPWRTLLLIMGLITLVTSVVFFFHVPDTPAQAWFLTEEERAWQVEVIRERNGSAGYGTRTIKRYQIWEALYDPATWLAGAFIFLSDVPNGASTSFATILLQGIGFKSTAQSLLMTMPGGGTEFVGCVLTGLMSMFVFKNQRMIYAVGASALCVLSYCLLAWGPNSGSQLYGYYSSFWFGPVGMIALLSNIGSNSGGYTKKLTTNGIFLMLYAAGNIVGPQTFKQSEQPEYPTGKASMAACDAAALGMILSLCLLNLYRNYRRNQRNELLPEGLANPEFADLTDFENPEFRYAM